MLPKNHALLGFILFFILIYFFDFSLFNGIIVMLSSVLIDIDHYLYYLYKKRDLSLKNAYEYFIKKKKKLNELSKEERKKFYSAFCFLHGIEILLILFLLGFFLSSFFYYILLGFSFHLICDYIWLFERKMRLDKISLIYDFIKFRKLKYID